MTDRMVGDEEIFDGMKKLTLSKEQMKQVSKQISDWANVTTSPVGVVFVACLEMIKVMGPAYCRIAVATLTKHLEKEA